MNRTLVRIFIEDRCGGVDPRGLRLSRPSRPVRVLEVPYPGPLSGLLPLSPLWFWVQLQSVLRGDMFPQGCLSFSSRPGVLREGSRKVPQSVCLGLCYFKEVDRGAGEEGRGLVPKRLGVPTHPDPPPLTDPTVTVHRFHRVR